MDNAKVEPGGAAPPLLRCPVCKARLGGSEELEEPCRRCQSDLGSLRRAHRQAAALQQQARRALVRGEHGAALAAAWRSVVLLDVPATRATLVAALTAAGRFTEASRLL